MYDYDGNGVLDKNDFEVNQLEDFRLKTKHWTNRFFSYEFSTRMPSQFFPVSGSEEHNHGRKGDMEPGKVS